jgi:hypothetical protein
LLTKDHFELTPHAILIGASAEVPKLQVNGGEQKEIVDLKKVSWDTNFITWFSPSVVEKLISNAYKKKTLDVEFVRTLQPKFASLQDPSAQKVKGLVCIDMSMVMYPNVVGIKGRFPLETYEEHLLQEHGHPSSARAKKPKEKTTDPYRLLNTTLAMNWLFNGPIMTRKKLQQITKSVADFIPKRVVPKEIANRKQTEQAEEQFKKQIGAIVEQLVVSYRETILLEADATGVSSLSSANEKDAEKRKKLFMFHLNKSGAYFGFKEQLKASVVHIVRSRFAKKSPFTHNSDLQLFMSQVYVYLVDQMHVAINGLFRETNEQLPTIKPDDSDSLERFANAAEENMLFEVAGKYHQERIAKYEDNMTAWLDYGHFCMRWQMVEKATECFREILSRQPKHVATLLTYGPLCCVEERYEEARVYLVTGVEAAPQSIIANTILVNRV